MCTTTHHFQPGRIYGGNLSTYELAQYTKMLPATRKQSKRRQHKNAVRYLEGHCVCTSARCKSTDVKYEIGQLASSETEKLALQYTK